MSRPGWPRPSSFLGLALLAFGVVGQVHARDALWNIVQGPCGQARGNAPVFPCVAVDARQSMRSAVLKDKKGDFQYLLVPLDRVPGMEDPRLGRGVLPNYFAQAWAARGFVEGAAGQGIAREHISLAINSSVARSQDQLHIHIDCLSPDAKRWLATLHPQRFRSGWKAVRPHFKGHRYRAHFVVGAALEQDPFHSLRQAVGGKGLGHRSLAVVGYGRPGLEGFWLLSSRADETRGDRGEGEEIQDHRCSVLDRERH
nr:CDP-diacylglycerol diphosphatase [Pseudoxanthomonas composti]